MKLAPNRAGGTAAVTLDATRTLFEAPRMAAIYAEVLGRHGIPTDPGTLGPLIREVWQEFSCLADPRYDRFASHAGGAPGYWRRFIERLCDRLEVDPPSRFASAELYERFAHAEAWRVYQDVAPTIAALRGQGMKLAVISNWDERLPRLLDNLGLSPHFDAVVYSQLAGVEKPHPAIFDQALARLGVAPERALHVGDSAREDVEGARAAGLQALQLVRGERAGDADSVIATLAELPQRLW